MRSIPAIVGAGVGAGLGYVIGRATGFGEPALITVIGAVAGCLIGAWISKSRTA